MRGLPPLSYAVTNSLMMLLSACSPFLKRILLHLRLRTQTLGQLKPDNVAVYVRSTNSVQFRIFSHEPIQKLFFEAKLSLW